MSDLIEIGDPSAAMMVAEPIVIGEAMLSKEEARQIVTNINRRMEQSRRDLLELYDREGWKALGYSSWGACVTAEFEGSSTALYRQLAAAKIEREVFGDSRIGNPVPASQLEAVKDLPTEQKRAAFERATELAGDQPRTARHIQQAAAEIAEPDLPIDFSIVQRRLAAHGVTLSYKDSMFVTHTAGNSVGIATPTWSNVTFRLEHMESRDTLIAPAAPAPAQHESSGQSFSSKAYDQLAARDAGVLERARNFIAAGEHAAARTILRGIEVATRERDQLLATIPSGRTITLEFDADECAALLKEARMFSGSELTKRLPTIGQTLILLVEAIKGTAPMSQPTADPIS